jgi:hypothetical protein
MTTNFDDFEVSDEGIPGDYKPLDPKNVKEKLPTFTSEKLCEMIVCDRYFGCFNEIAIDCMEELAKRRIEGSDFEFEKYIEKSFAELPVLEFKIPDLGDVLRTIIGSRNK